MKENLTPQKEFTLRIYFKSDKKLTTKKAPIKHIQITLIK